MVREGRETSGFFPESLPHTLKLSTLKYFGSEISHIQRVRKDKSMRIVIIGGAGTQGNVIARDISENPDVKEILIADWNEAKAKETAASLNDPRVKSSFVDAYDIDATANLIKGYDAVINSGQYDINVSVMKACLKAKVRHYTDVGGAFHWTRQQLELMDDVKKGGLTAVIGAGLSPGITDVMARYAYDRLDEVEAVHVEGAVADLTDTKGISVWRPTSLRTELRATLRQTIEYRNGEHRTLPPLAGERMITFPEPIGQLPCHYVVHPELATIPIAFKDKGIKDVTLSLNMGVENEVINRCLAMVGMASDKPLMVRGVEVIPLEVVAAAAGRETRERLEGVELELNKVNCFRSRVIGKKDGKKLEYSLSTFTKPHSRWKVDHVTGVPLAITAQMQLNGMISEPGIWSPEQVIDPEYFFQELAKREIYITAEIKERLAGID